MKKLKQDLENKEDQLHINEDTLEVEIKSLQRSAEFLLAPYFKNKTIEASVDLSKNDTKGIPLLLYRPTRLIKSQIEEIDQQKEETKERIEKIRKEFDIYKEKELNDIFELNKAIQESNCA